MQNKSGYDVKALAGLAVVFVVIAIILSFGSTILDSLQDNYSDDNSTAYNATQDGLESLGEFSSWLPTLALIIIAAVIIGVIIRYFAV